MKERSLPAALSLFLVMICPHLACAGGLLLEAARGSEKPIASAAPVTSTKLSLSGSRAEVLNFQLRIRAPGCVQLSFATEQAGLPAAVFFGMPYVKTREPSFPGAYVGSHHDPLPPLQGNRICPIPSAPGADIWAWGEISLPASLPPGDYQARIIATAGEERRELPVQLHVWKMKMPEKPVLPFYAEYSSWYGVLGHFGHTHPKETELGRLYARSLRAHRIQPMKFWAQVPSLRPEKGAPGLDLDKAAPGSLSFRELVLGEKPSWALFDFPRPLGDLAKQEELYWQAAEKEIRREGLAGKAFVYLWDEPKAADYPQLIALAEKVKKAAPSLKILVTTSQYERQPRNAALERNVDIFVPVWNDWAESFHPASMQRYQELRKSGKEVWTYLSCMSHGCSRGEESGLPDWVIDRPATWVRAMGWLWSRMELDGFLYYDVDYAYQFHPAKDPWNDLWYFHGNGDGTLFYPGRPGEHGLESHEPVASIRLKIWREASFDAEYIRWMNGLKNPPSWWKTELESLAPSPRSWSHKYSDYQNLRDKAGAYLDQNL
jgi:Domain of unknown function (DUF4091)